MLRARERAVGDRKLGRHRSPVGDLASERQLEIDRTFAAVLGAYPGRLFTAPDVLSIRYLAPLQNTAMICLGFFLKNS